MSQTGYNRVLVKLSGEALADESGSGVCPAAAETIARQIAELAAAGIGVGVVVGAGNFVRGRALKDAAHIQPTTADYMGMLGTVMNALALRDTLVGLGTDAEVFSAIAMPLVCRSYFRPAVIDALEAGRVVIFPGGTSHPGVTTDMAAAIRANDIDAGAVLKATKVDGVYDKDPVEHPDATKYETLTYQAVLDQRLGVMDLPAMAFCMERNLPVVVFNMNRPGNLLAAAQGQNVGTVVRDS
jgi:uridylate kinase